ncbi:uncharacterized protein PG986_000426 [Apiospora aurea]|uniref:Uncharacterized protein n=1 Tax=Apiospora aurea TaxID=335848 RepID=A0ABR1QU80_9PEZI
MASTSASTSGSPVTASGPNVTMLPPPTAGQQQQAGFHVAPPAQAHVPMHYQQQTFQLTPQMEEGIKAAVAATNPGLPAPPRKKRSSWTMAKYFLRCATLIACVGMIIAEVIVAITQRAELDTAISVIWRSESTSRAEVTPPEHPTPTTTPPPPPPAQIVVHYVQNTCPKCGTQSWPQPGEELNEHLASKGDLQPQAIPLSQLQVLPRAAG